MASAKILQPNGHANGKCSKDAMREIKSSCNGGLASNRANDSDKMKDDRNSKSALALQEVRQKFMEYAQAHPDKVNERDREKLLNDEWYLKRYLLARNRKVKDTLEMLKKTMEWRNEFGIHISEDAMFPLEFYKIGALFPYENDKEGNLVLFLRIKYHRKITEMVEVEKHFLVHTFEKIDRITNGQGLVIIFDCQGAGYANCDIEFLQFLITCATEHAPVGLQYIIVYKLPWFMNAFWSIVSKILPNYLASRVRFCDETSILNFIDKDKLPDFVGGECKRNYRWIPPGCPSVFKLANAHGITDAEIDKILPQFQSLLDEAEEALANSTYEDPPDAITKYINNAETAPDLLSDLALCSVGFKPSAMTANANGLTSDGIAQEANNNEQQDNNLIVGQQARDETSSVFRLFPYESIEFIYDAYSDIFHASVTIFNPSQKNSLAFKLMSNRPSKYSVKPARGVLSPNNSVTISIVLLNEHQINDKFLIVAQPLEGLIRSISAAQFNSLWSTSNTQQSSSISSASQSLSSFNPTTHTSIKLGSYLRKIVTSPAIQSTIKNPQLNELITTCRSLRRRQSLSVIVNLILLIIVINFMFFN